jgi:hypothetical protein
MRAEERPARWSIRAKPKQTLQSRCDTKPNFSKQAPHETKSAEIRTREFKANI